MARQEDGGASGEESRSREPLGTPKTFEATERIKDHPKTVQATPDIITTVIA